VINMKFFFDFLLIMYFLTIIANMFQTFNFTYGVVLEVNDKGKNIL
jgi:hypothetical protein